MDITQTGSKDMLLNDIAVSRPLTEGESRSDYVAVWLREAIYSGELSPGDPIGQDVVADRLGMSRIPVREALRKLESEGLIDNPPHRTARVAMPNFAECEQIYKIRERLEPLALTENMMNMNSRRIDRSAELAAQLPTLTTQPAAWLATDRAFHLSCFDGLETTRLTELIVGFWSATQLYRRLLISTFRPADFQLQHTEHELILEAIRDGNTRAAETLLQMHIERSRIRLTSHKELLVRMH